MPRPSHYSRFNHPHNIGWGIQIRSLQQIFLRISRKLYYASNMFWLIFVTFRPFINIRSENIQLHLMCLHQLKFQLHLTHWKLGNGILLL
jgi:hypothetical protein